MKVVKTVLSVIGIAFFLLMALGCLLAPAYLSAALFLILALWISPLSKSLKESFVNTTGKKITSIVVCVILFFVAIGVYPSTGRTQNTTEETIENEVADVEESVEERSMPEEQSTEVSEAENITTSSDNESADTSNNQNDSNIVVADSSNEQNSNDSTLSTTQNSHDDAVENHDSASQENTQSSTDAQTNIQTSSDDSANQSAVATTTQASETPVTQPSEAAASQVTDNSSNPSSSSGNANNFNLYNNPEQQQTTETWVLNTSRMKIHYPSCSSVAQISPENYAVSSQSLQELMAMGYTTCGRCFK